MDDGSSEYEQDEEEMFSRLLRSMGVSSWEETVPIALADYARRCTIELLCDAKDYASHSGRAEISADDIYFAAKISDNNLNQMDIRARNLPLLAKEINQKSLIDYLTNDREKRSTRYNGDLLIRPNTYVPGKTAYSVKTDDNGTDMEDVETRTATASNRQVVKKLNGDKFPGMNLASKDRKNLKELSIFHSSQEVDNMS